MALPRVRSVLPRVCGAVSTARANHVIRQRAAERNYSAEAESPKSESPEGGNNGLKIALGAAAAAGAGYLIYKVASGGQKNPPEIVQKIEDGYKKLQLSNSNSLIKKYLTKDVVDALKNKSTSMGATLWDCIQSGVANLDSGVGIYAPDAESYTVFSKIFYPIISDYHIGFDLAKGAKHPAPDFGLDRVAQFENMDPEGKYVISTRVRCGRTMKEFPFNPLLKKEQYEQMEQRISQSLSSLTGELAGKYYPLTGMTKSVQKQLIDDHFLFKEGDRFLQEAQACRFWPTGRGIYHNDNKTFLIWCNEEDHMRIISMQKGGDLKEIYTRLIKGVQAIEKKIPFAHDPRLGYLTFCPSNLGTTIRASVHIKLPKLAKNEQKFKEIAAKYNLQVRGTAGEHTASVGGVYDVSNKRRMGLTEYEAVKEMYDGVRELIKLEKQQ